MNQEAYIEMEGIVEISGEWVPSRTPENPFEPLRRLGKRPFIAS